LSTKLNFPTEFFIPLKLTHVKTAINPVNSAFTIQQIILIATLVMGAVNP
jgi:hypothetical protein